MNVWSISKQGVDRIPYEVALRVMGTWLDGVGANGVNLLELSDSYNLRFVTNAQEDAQIRRFRREDIVELDKQQAGDRQRRRTFHSKSSPDPLTDRYADLLRAVGRELDKVQAYSVAVEQVSDELVVTYQYLDPGANYLPYKRMAAVKKEDREALIHDAVSNRERPPSGFGARLFR